MFADDIALSGGKEMRGLRVSRPKTKFMDFTFEQSEQGNRCKRYSFQITRDEYRRGMWYGNGDHKAGLSRLKKWEEMRAVA